MAEKSVIEMDRRLDAGREYLSALNKLGFRPDALFWMGAGSNEAERMELGIVTSWADNIGPKAVYDLLFEAYDVSATPKEIDPFTVTIFSPESQVAIDLAGGMRAIKHDKGAIDPAGAMFVLGMFDYFTTPSWVIYYREAKHTRFDDARNFRAFQLNVEQLAA